MQWVLVAVSVATLLRSTSGAALPVDPSSDATTLIHSGHQADLVRTERGFQLKTVKKQAHDESDPVFIRYNANIPSEEDLRVRRQLQQGGNTVGQPTVQFFRDVGSFNREIQRLFGSIQGQTATGTTAGGNSQVTSSTQGNNNIEVPVPNPAKQTTGATTVGNNQATSSTQGNNNIGKPVSSTARQTTGSTAGGNNQATSSTQGNNNIGISISNTASQGSTKAGVGSTQQATANSKPGAAAATSAAPGASNTPGTPNVNTGIPLTESNRLVNLERSKNNKNTGNSQVTSSSQGNNRNTGNSQATLNSQGNNNVGISISNTASQGSNKAGSSNNVNQQTVGSFDSQKLGVQNTVSQGVLIKDLNNRIANDKNTGLNNRVANDKNTGSQGVLIMDLNNRIANDKTTGLNNGIANNKNAGFQGVFLTDLNRRLANNKNTGLNNGIANDKNIVSQGVLIMELNNRIANDKTTGLNNGIANNKNAGFQGVFLTDLNRRLANNKNTGLNNRIANDKNTGSQGASLTDLNSRIANDKNLGSQGVLITDLNNRLANAKSTLSSVSNSADTSTNIAATGDTHNSNSNAKSLSSSTPEVAGINNANIGSIATQNGANLVRPLNIITNFPAHSFDATNYPVILLAPNDINSVFGLNDNTGIVNNEVSRRISNTGVNTEQNNNIANEGVASAGIRRLIEKIRNPTNQSPKEIFLEELANSGIASSLKASADNSVPNNLGAQSLANTGGGNQVNAEQSPVNVNNQGQSSFAEQTQGTGIQSQLPSQNQLPIFGQGNANLGALGVQVGANKNLIAIPVHVDQAGNVIFNPGSSGISTNPAFTGGPHTAQNQLRIIDLTGLSQRQKQQSATGPNNNGQTNQITSIDNSDPRVRAQGFASIGGRKQVNDAQTTVQHNNQRQSLISGQTQVSGLGSSNTGFAGQNTGRPAQTAFTGGPQITQNQLKSISFAGFPQRQIQQSLAGLPQGQTQQSFTGLPQRQTQQSFAGLPQQQSQQSFAGLPQQQSQQGFAGTNNNRQTFKITSVPLVTIEPNSRAQNQPGNSLNQSHRFSTQGQINDAAISGSFRPGANSFHQPSANNPQSLSGQNAQVNTQSSVNSAQDALGNFPQFFTPKGPPKWGFFSNRFCNPPHRCKVVSDFGVFNPIQK